MQVLQEPITILGAGSWGTALALVLARNGNNVRLWSVVKEEVDQLTKERENKQFLPGHVLPENIQIYGDLAGSLEAVRDVLLVVPSHAFRSVLQQVKKIVPTNIRIAWGTKGLDPDTKNLLHEVTAEIFSESTPAAVISGPSFAKEVADELPAAVCLASNNHEFSNDLVARFNCDRFQVTECSDFVGVQICGVVKNIMAIAIGISDGLQLGANARAALITRGLAEIAVLSNVLGGKSETLMSLAGVGDLVLTCTENLSRNRRFGLAVGQGKNRDQAEKEIAQVVEGISNTQQVYELAHTLNIKMPIVERVHAILFNNESPQSLWSGC